MGEYAKYMGRSIKIGTCENMYYLRADQAELVTGQSGSLHPVRDAGSIRFRFPFPNEDRTAPGEFDDYGYSLPIPGAVVPEDVEHYSVQFKAQAGYLVSLPCPESGNRELELMEYRVHRNGFGGAVRISQQRVWEGRLVLVADCGGCGAKYRMPTLDDAGDILSRLDKLAHDERLEGNRYGSPTRAEFYDEISRRILAGYTNPPAWVAATV